MVERSLGLCRNPLNEREHVRDTVGVCGRLGSARNDLHDERAPRFRQR